MTLDLEGQRRRRLVLLLVLAGAALLVAVVLFVVLRSCAPEQEEVPNAAVVQPDLSLARQPDAAPPAPDAAADAEARRPFRGRRITDRELRALQRRFRGPIYYCYDRAASRAASLVTKKSSIMITLGRGGAIRDVTVHAASDPQLELCLRRIIRAWRFSPALKAQKISFSIVFVH